MGKESSGFPNFIVFEGLDGVGKTTFVNELGNYYRNQFPNLELFVGRVSGEKENSLGNWVYNMRHGRALGLIWPENKLEVLSLEEISSLCLELMHMVAHIQSILTEVRPVLERNGNVILDRFWWSIYVFIRDEISKEEALTCVWPELLFWKKLPKPIVFYLVRRDNRFDFEDSVRFDTYYRELFDFDPLLQIEVVENNNSKEETWVEILNILNLPYRELGDHKSSLDS